MGCSVKFTNPIIFFLVIPTGATTGQRIVIDGRNGTISVYDQFNTLYAWMAATQVGPDSNYTMLRGIGSTGGGHTVSLFNGLIRFDAAPNRSAPIQVNYGYILGNFFNSAATERPILGLAAPSAGNGGQARLTLYGTSPDSTRTPAVDIDNNFAVEMDVNVMGFVRRRAPGGVNATWMQLTLLNGWVNDLTWGLRVRLLPDGTAICTGRINGGTITDGIQLGTLPASVTPFNREEFFAVCPTSTGPYSPPVIRIQETGEVFLFYHPPTFPASLHIGPTRWATFNLPT